MFRRVILYFRKIKLEQKFSLTTLLVPSWNHPLTKTKFPPIFTTQQQVLTPYQPLQTRPTNFFSLQNLKLVVRAEQLRGGGDHKKVWRVFKISTWALPSLTLPFTFSCAHHLLQLTHKTFTLSAFSPFFHSRHSYRILLLLFLPFVGQPAFLLLRNMAASPNPWT